MIAYKFLRHDGSSVFTGFAGRCRTASPERGSRRRSTRAGFVAAAIAEARGGADAYRAERARQSAWLLERLGL